MSGPIRTIGYEHLTVDDLVAAMKARGIGLVIDVREAPVSRRKGFAKGPLSASIRAAGLDYLHLRDLGNPKAGREAARGGDKYLYRQIFDAHMETPEAQAALAEAASAFVRTEACLMCLEADPLRCHRAIVAIHLAQRLDREIDHIAT